MTPTHSVVLVIKIPFLLGPQLSQRKECPHGSADTVVIHILCEQGMVSWNPRIPKNQHRCQGPLACCFGTWSLTLIIPFTSPPSSLIFISAHYVWPCVGDGLG